MTASAQGRVRVMHLTHDMAIGGLQRVVATICSGIDRQRFDVSVLCMRALGDFAGDLQHQGIAVELLPQKESGVDYLAFLKVARILKRERIQVLHTHNTLPFIDGTAAALLAGVKTVIHTDHARMFPDKRRYMVAENVMSRFVYRVVGVSPHTTANLRRYERISGKKLITIPNGVDGSAFMIHLSKNEARKALGIAPDRLVIGLATRLCREKGITYLIRALKQILELHPSLLLTVAGEGELKQELMDEAQTLGVLPHTLFLGACDRIPLFLKALDLLAFPSISEGLPMALLEGMAAGCPIVATRVGGMPDAIEHNGNGLVVSPHSPDELANAISQILASEELRSRFGLRSKEIFEQRFDASIMTRTYERLYLRCD